MLTKYRLFGIFNLLISLGLMFLLSHSLRPAIPPIGSIPMPFNLEFVLSYLPEFITTTALIINLTLAYKLLIKKQISQFKLYAIWTGASVFWVIFTFIGYFFASNVSFLIISLLLTALVYYFIQKISRKSALYISALTVVVIIISIGASFEENYCWGEGDEALAKSGTETVIATIEDEQKLNGASGIRVKAGEPVYTHFRAHFICHRDFEFSQALKEKYLFSN